MNIKDILEEVDYKIFDTWEYGWNSFGNVVGVDIIGNKPDSHCGSFLFVKGTNKVVNIEVWECVGEKSKVYRWVDPKFLKDYKKEFKKKTGRKFEFVGFDSKTQKYIDCSPKKILNIASKVAKN